MTACLQSMKSNGPPARIRDEFRYRIQTDVFYLANNVLRSPRQAPLIHSVHDSIIAAYPTPNPEVPFGEWSPLKTRILLAARRSLKTTLGECWLTSAILCDPNSRTLILSGNMPASEARCRGVRQHLSNEVILELFPEYDGKLSSEMATYWCPAATEKHRDPTIQTGTFESVKTGQHPSLCIWLDDCTNELTCSSAVTVAKTLSRYYDLDPLLEDEPDSPFLQARAGVTLSPTYPKLLGSTAKLKNKNRTNAATDTSVFPPGPLKPQARRKKLRPGMTAKLTTA